MGILLAVEGIDNSGKTTLVAGLARRLTGCWRAGLHREPSNGPIGRVFRQLGATDDTDALALACMSAADRLAQQRPLRCLLDRTDVVLSDRYYLSGLAYHAADGVDPRLYQRLGAGVRRPDAYLLLEVDPGRAARRGAAGPDSRWEGPRIAAALGEAYARCVRLIERTEGARVIRIDANRSCKAVETSAFAAVLDLLAAPRPRRENRPDDR